MRSRSWLMLGMLAFPSLAAAQTVKEADLVGAWRAELQYPEQEERIGLVLWPGGLWLYTGGSFVGQDHGGARWRLVGDTLWLANDYFDYFHPMVQGLLYKTLRAYGHLGVMDTAIINSRPPYPVPDSVYWSKAFRDSTTACAGSWPCPTWVYQVSKSNQQIHLVLLESLSRNAEGAAIKAVFTRDSLMGCTSIDTTAAAGADCIRR